MDGVRARPVRDDDRELLYRVYASTRQEELSVLDWSDAEKEAFLRMQFDAQHAHYLEHFADARFEVLESAGEPIGRLYVDRRSDEIRIIDIALLPEWRRRGIGRALLEELLEEAARARQPVRIHVEQQNPAMRLYLRLGFVEIADEGVYRLMEWRPPLS